MSTSQGILQNDIELFPNAHLDEQIKYGIVEDFIIDRKTGRFLGGGYPVNRAEGETFTIVSQGNKNTEFKAYFAEPWSGWMMSINIVEHKETYKKPFVYFTMPNPIIITGTCVKI